MLRIHTAWKNAPKILEKRMGDKEIRLL